MTRNEQMTKDASDFHRLLRDKNKEIKTIVLKKTQVEEQYQNIYTEKKMQHRENMESSGTLHRDNKAMKTLLEKYRKEVQELRRHQQRSVNLRKHFEELEHKRVVRSKWKRGFVKTRVHQSLILKSSSTENSSHGSQGPSSDGPGNDGPESERPVSQGSAGSEASCDSKAHDDAEKPSELIKSSLSKAPERKRSLAFSSVSKHSTLRHMKLEELDQAIQIEQQLLLLRNNCLCEFEVSTSTCTSVDAKMKLEELLKADYQGMNIELVEMEKHIHTVMIELIPSMQIKYLLSFKSNDDMNFQQALSDLSETEDEMKDAIATQRVPPLSTSLLWKAFVTSGGLVIKRPRILSLDDLTVHLDAFWCYVLQEERVAEQAHDHLPHDDTSLSVRGTITTTMASPSDLRTLPEMLLAHLGTKYETCRAASLHVTYSILRAVDHYAESPPIHLFAEASVGDMDSAGWRYFYRIKSCIDSLQLKLNTADDARAALHIIYPRNYDTATIDRMLAMMILRYQDGFTRNCFFEYMAESILQNEELRLQSCLHLLKNHDTDFSRALCLSDFIDVVLEIVIIPRGVHKHI